MSTTPNSRAIVLLGHGSRGTVAARPFARMRAWLGAVSGVRCEDAYLELSPPTLEDVVDRLAGQGIGEITLLLVFLVEGHQFGMTSPRRLRPAKGRIRMCSLGWRRPWILTTLFWKCSCGV